MKFRFWTGNEVKQLKENQIFVFGSNPSGYHGAGAAKAAKEKFGAINYNGRGIQGQSYALVTKNLKPGYRERSTGIVYEKSGYKSVSEEQITANIQELYDFARENPDKFFIVIYKNDTWPNGSPKKSLNGYNGEEIFNMFMAHDNKPDNIILHDSFKPLAAKYLQALNVPQQEPQPSQNSFRPKLR